MAERIWYTSRNGQRQGPFSDKAMQQSVAYGQLLPSDLVWTEGMAQWAPASDVPELIALEGGGDVYEPVGMPASSSPPLDRQALRPTAAGQTYGGVTLGYHRYSLTLPYAGFWLRVAAALLDGILMTVAGAVAGAIIGAFAGAAGAMNSQGLDPAVTVLIQVVTTLMQWLYFSLMECSEKQATLGKLAVGIRVTGLDGERIGFGKATGRYFGKFVSAIILCIGFMMAGWTQKKQGLHDMMAGTLVVKK